MVQRAGIALGTNLGDKGHLLREAAEMLRNLADPAAPFLRSGIYRTEPCWCPPGSPDYLNAAVEFGWAGTARELLQACQEIEQRLGRVRSGIVGEPRTADVDLLYLDDQIICEAPSLILPHPRLHERRFVLKPLADICPERVIPGVGRSVADLSEALQTDEAEPVLTAETWL
jgi:2-amino-4-hydroxy-6-hydroxymethyldihydropteridine diphosphokinase